jgi:predicted metal-binding protein
MVKDIDAILLDLRTVHPDLLLISTKMIVVSDWVRLKCRYGCRAYGRQFCCPPYSPTSEETRRVLSEYDSAIVVRLQASMPGAGASRDQAMSSAREAQASLQRIICDLEKKAFLSGCYKAFGMGATPCGLCQSCVAEERLEKGEAINPLDIARCRHRDLIRPSMEACGIDVFKTLMNSGFDPRVLTHYSDMLEIFGLLLLD